MKSSVLKIVINFDGFRKLFRIGPKKKSKNFDKNSDEIYPYFNIFFFWTHERMIVLSVKMTHFEKLFFFF